MIRINLLGQARPKAARRPVDTGAALPAVFIGAGVLLGGLVLGYIYYSWASQLSAENTRIKQLQIQKNELQQTKAQTIADVLGEEGFARSLSKADLEYLFAEE